MRITRVDMAKPFDDRPVLRLVYFHPIRDVVWIVPRA